MIKKEYLVAAFLLGLLFHYFMNKKCDRSFDIYEGASPDECTNAITGLGDDANVASVCQGAGCNYVAPNTGDGTPESCTPATGETISCSVNFECGTGYTLKTGTPTPTYQSLDSDDQKKSSCCDQTCENYSCSNGGTPRSDSDTTRCNGDCSDEICCKRDCVLPTSKWGTCNSDCTREISAATTDPLNGGRSCVDVAGDMPPCLPEEDECPATDYHILWYIIGIITILFCTFVGSAVDPSSIIGALIGFVVGALAYVGITTFALDYGPFVSDAAAAAADAADAADGDSTE